MKKRTKTPAKKTAKKTKSTRTVKTNPSLELAKKIAHAAGKIKAKEISILDLSKLGTFTDYFVVASGTSDRHVEAIADSVAVEMKKLGFRPIGIEGYDHSQWIIVDFGDVVAHIFYQPLRELYAIEKLWADAKRLRVKY
jgi:ribosome-associated protein